MSYEANPNYQQDLMQDVLLSIWQALPEFRGDGTEKAYIARIAQNRCFTHIRRAAKQPPSTDLNDELVDELASIEDSMNQLQSRQQLMSAVQKLPLKLRQVVTLSLEGFGPKQISEICDLSENNVSVRLNRARSVLKQQLGELT